MLLLVTFSVLLTSSTIFAKPEVLQCAPCEQSQCPAIGDCPRGITWDVCRCCEVCAKKSGEECGGPWNAYGKCGYELTCLKDARECPYLFSPKGSTNTNICDEYLFNAIGRCVEDENVPNNPAFKRGRGYERAPYSMEVNAPQKEQLALNIEGEARDPSGLLKLRGGRKGNWNGKRLMLRGVLRGVEY